MTDGDGIRVWAERITWGVKSPCGAPGSFCGPRVRQVPVSRVRTLRAGATRLI